MSDEPWYADGLKFKCSQCGDCCTGAPGFVWVNREEIVALAALVGEADAEKFEREYVKTVGVRKSLREYPNGDCVFFNAETRKCTVYAARPRQCRTWPFWDSNLSSPEAWSHTCEVCPGSGQGQVYQLEDIEKLRTVMHI